MSSISIETSRFGAIDVEDNRVLSFIEPVLGFEQSNRYVLLDHADDSPFKWLQSADEPDLAFVVTNPKLFGIDYEFMVPDDQVEKMTIESVEDVVVLTIVNIPQGDPSAMTTNLLGPIIINQKNKQALQLVLNDPSFSTKTPLLDKLDDLQSSEEASHSASTQAE